MKKWLSILGAIGLTTTCTTSLISCQKRNNNENTGGDKPKPNNPQQPQEPPIGSNWKWYSGDELNHGPTNKWYILISKSTNSTDAVYAIDLIHFTTSTSIKPKYPLLKSIYRWEELNKPSLPIIDNKTGKISNWKE
ncbi:lipoprotein [Spiroplasma endosymbiont of Stenodema calcarata]|uniref:lipoprotein n=1 Tax=Spiroplasma endosymbiont of Stenodema calcarata TaxID=3139328 RepID=UPI003CCB029C